MLAEIIKSPTSRYRTALVRETARSNIAFNAVRATSPPLPQKDQMEKWLELRRGKILMLAIEVSRDSEKCQE